MTHPFVDFYGLGIDYFKLIKQGGCFFIGASVTAQRNGWVDKFALLISEKLECPIKVGKKAMGGVGLLFGLTNWVDLDIPSGRVVFIEFSTGDLNLGLTPLDRLAALLESLIIDILNRNSFPIIVHNWRSDFRGEKGDVVRGVYGAVASRLRVPVVRNDLFIEAEIEKDFSIETTWFRDNCHTNPEGVNAYAHHVLEAISLLSSQTVLHPGSVRLLHKPIGEVEPVFCVDKYFTSCHYTIRTYIYPNTGQEFPVYDCDPSVEFEAVVSGELMGVAFISGPRSAWVELLIDEQRKQRFRCFDKHSYYERFIMLPAFYQLSNNLVKMRLIPEPVDFSITKKEHSDFEKERKMQLVAIVGVDLKLDYPP